MFWFILLGLLIILFIVLVILSIVKRKSNNRDTFIGASFLLFVIICIFGGIVILKHFECKKEINNFKKQKYYIEQVVPTLPNTDNYAMTQIRIELNTWLYDVQYKKDKFGIFTMYPKEVLELEEIK